jgi:hypothetical protein
MTRQDQATPSPAALVRGTFTWSRWEFTVRASSAEAPDSFQVFANGNPADIVLIVSGITGGNLHATWGDGWRAYDAEWKRRFRDHAFLVFYNGTQAPAARRGERFCDG